MCEDGFGRNRGHPPFRRGNYAMQMRCNGSPFLYVDLVLPIPPRLYHLCRLTILPSLPFPSLKRVMQSNAMQCQGTQGNAMVSLLLAWGSCFANKPHGSYSTISAHFLSYFSLPTNHPTHPKSSSSCLGCPPQHWDASQGSTQMLASPGADDEEPPLHHILMLASPLASSFASK